MTESDAFLSMSLTSSQFGLRLSCCRHLWVIPVCSTTHSSGGFSQSVSGYSSLPAGLLATAPFTLRSRLEPFLVITRKESESLSLLMELLPSFSEE